MLGNAIGIKGPLIVIIEFISTFVTFVGSRMMFTMHTKVH